MIVSVSQSFFEIGHSRSTCGVIKNDYNVRILTRLFTNSEYGNIPGDPELFPSIMAVIFLSKLGPKSSMVGYWF